MRLERSARPDRNAGPEYSAPHPAQRLLVAPRWMHHLTAVGMGSLTLGLGVASLIIIPPAGTGAAVWWPAAGTGVLFALLFRGPVWVPLSVIAATGLVANLVAGRPLAFAIVALVILTVEASVVLAIVGRHGEHARLNGVRGLGRLFVACVAGALALALLGSTSLFVLAGAPILPTALALTLSHLSALLLMVPIALVPLSRRTLRVKPLRIVEGVAQFTVTLTLATILFSPVLPVPLLFLLFPLFAWAATRFRPLYVVAQLAAIALLIPALFLLVGGPYLATTNVPTPGLLVQLFMISAAITTLFLAVGRSEREALLDERERRAVLLRGGFIGAQVGFLVAERSPAGELQIVESNEVGRQMAQGGWLEPIIDAWLHHPQNDLTQEVTLDTGRSYQVFASVTGHALHEDDDASAVGIQLVEITDTIAARDALARTLERERAVTLELRELARQKDVFVSAVSHELRTPITSILGFAEEIDDTGPHETKQAAEIIIRNSRRLAAMVEQLLELGRLASPETHLHLGSARLDALVGEAVEEQSVAAERAGLMVDADLHADGREVLIEPLSLGRILTNLLSNAIKFTPRGGIVRVSTNAHGPRAIIMVDDSGVGISPDERHRVFDRFYRSASEEKLATPGTGLGLPIVKALVESAGGTITIDDSPIGGTRFIVELPLASSGPMTGSIQLRRNGRQTTN